MPRRSRAPASPPARAGSPRSPRRSSASARGCTPRATPTGRPCCARSPRASTRRSRAGRPRAARTRRPARCCAPSWPCARSCSRCAPASASRAQMCPRRRRKPRPTRLRRARRARPARGGAWSASSSRADTKGPTAKVRDFSDAERGPMAVLIKRYANRKLYNTETSRYITLKGIADLLEQNQEVKVIENESGEDITSVTLSQILVDTERDGRSVPGNLLSELFQRGGDVLYDAVRKRVDDASEGIEELKGNVRRLLRPRGRDWVAFAAPDLETIVQRAFERVAEMLDLPRRSDLDQLSARLDRVARALEALEPKTTNGSGTASGATPAERKA